MKKLTNEEKLVALEKLMETTGAGAMWESVENYRRSHGGQLPPQKKEDKQG